MLNSWVYETRETPISDRLHYLSQSGIDISPDQCSSRTHAVLEVDYGVHTIQGTPPLGGLGSK
jgi:hypothetical protein